MPRTGCVVPSNPAAKLTHPQIWLELRICFAGSAINACFLLSLCHLSSLLHWGELCFFELGSKNPSAEFSYFSQGHTTEYLNYRALTHLCNWICLFSRHLRKQAPNPSQLNIHCSLLYFYFCHFCLSVSKMFKLSQEILNPNSGVVLHQLNCVLLGMVCHASLHERTVPVLPSPSNCFITS